MARTWRKMPTARGRVRMYGICYRPDDYLAIDWGLIRLYWEKS